MSIGSRTATRLQVPILATIALLSATFAAPARGSAILTPTAEVAPAGSDNGQPLYQYTYILTEPVDHPPSLTGFSLSLPADLVLTDLGNTPDWSSVYQAGDKLVAWSSPGPSTDISPGSAGRFRFTSPLLPPSLAFNISYYDPDEDDTLMFGGQVATPKPGDPGPPVPEPTSVAVFLAGAWMIRRRVRRPRVPA